MLHIFDGPWYVKNEKYMKKRDCNHTFHIFLYFHVAGSTESMKHGYSLDEELNFTSSEYSHSKQYGRVLEPSFQTLRESR